MLTFAIFGVAWRNYWQHWKTSSSGGNDLIQKCWHLPILVSLEEMIDSIEKLALALGMISFKNVDICHFWSRLKKLLTDWTRSNSKFTSLRSAYGLAPLAQIMCSSGWSSFTKLHEWALRWAQRFLSSHKTTIDYPQSLWKKILGQKNHQN